MEKPQSDNSQSSNQNLNIKIESFKQSPSDTGSSEVQIAQLTKRVQQLSEHFKTHKKDFHSQTGLIRIINKRKKLLAYLKNKSFKNYQSVVQKLGLRK